MFYGIDDHFMIRSNLIVFKKLPDSAMESGRQTFIFLTN